METTVSARDQVMAVAKKVVKNQPNVQAAVREVLDRIDDDLREAFLEEAVEMAVRNLIHQVRSEMREEVRQSPTPVTNMNPSKINLATARATTAAVEKTIFETWTVRNKWLGEATGQDLDQVIEEKRGVIAGHSAHLRFYEFLRQKVGDRQMVKNAIRPEDAQKFWDRVKPKE